MDPFNATLPVILLVDDDPSLHLWADRGLPRDNYRTISCLDGKQGLEAYKEFSPDIVILDIEMPTMNGITTCAEIRKLSGIDIPIVMMTATGDEGNIERSYAAGATEFIRKPINWQILRYRLDNMLKAAKLGKSELRLANAKKVAGLGDWEWQIGQNWVHWSDEVYAMTGSGKHEFIPTRRNFQSFIHQKDLPYVRRQLFLAIKGKVAPELDFRVMPAIGGERFVSQRVETVYNHNAKLTGLVGTLQDITEKKVQEDRIRHLAYYDEVTQLPNRAFFLKFLAKTIDLAKKDNRIFAVLFLDLDGFKGINDTYGHQAGDLLLKEISRRLTEGLRCSDMASRYLERLENGMDVARLGGDEFVILLNNLARPDQAATVAERIQGWITEPVPLGDRLAHVGVSTGIAVYPHNGEDSVTLLKNADIAMYHAKKFGKGHFRFFHEEMATAAKRRLEMETHMHHAIANGELRLFYQAIIDAETGRLAGAEVLLRWDSLKLGFLLPDDFIPLAEENGMIIPFGEWAVREACCQNQAWRLEGLSDLELSINIGSLQFNDVEFVPMIVQAIQEYGISPESLTFEMAESTLMADSAKIGEKMAELKGLGVKLALDGFGTGYSSMRCPGLFPLDTIKVNLAFVNGLPPGADAAGMVNAVLAMARALKLRTVVTGIETLQQRDALVDVASGAMQGYFFSRPLAADEFKAVWLQKGSHPRLKRGQH